MGFDKLGENIRQLRIEHGMTQERLADLAEISLTYLSKIENNKANNVSLSLVERLADALHVTPVYLLGTDDLDEVLNIEIMHRLSECSESDKRKFLKIMDILTESEV